MTQENILTQAKDLAKDDYFVLGVATCFVREDGETKELQVLEPIPSAALEALAKGIPTSYRLACATTLGEVFGADKTEIPAMLATDETVNFCDRFAERAISATRTFKSNPQAQNLIPVGTVKDDFNYSLERKRVLNNSRVISQEDNIKQHSHTHKIL